MNLLESFIYIKNFFMIDKKNYYYRRSVLILVYSINTILNLLSNATEFQIPNSFILSGTLTKQLRYDLVKCFQACVLKFEYRITGASRSNRFSITILSSLRKTSRITNGLRSSRFAVSGDGWKRWRHNFQSYGAIFGLWLPAGSTISRLLQESRAELKTKGEI